MNAERRTHRRRSVEAAALASALLALVAGLGGCVTTPGPDSAALSGAIAAPVRSPMKGRIVAGSERMVIYEAGDQDTIEELARRYLGARDRAWEIAEFNGVEGIAPGDRVAIPLHAPNAVGVIADRYQTVPILCYHRLGSRVSKMTLAPGTFADQLDFLARNGYTVVRLSALVDFLTGKRPLPRRSVVITFDDGYASTYHHAFPLLKRYGFPATVFVYTDFIGSRDGLSWQQLREMLDSGIVEIQAHSKTHANLTLREADESDARYRRRIDTELQVPKVALQQNLAIAVESFAFPYGDASEVVIDRAAKAGYRLAATVNPGGNPFYASPLVLRRTMVFGDRGLEAFKSALQVSKPIGAR